MVLIFGTVCSVFELALYACINRVVVIVNQLSFGNLESLFHRRASALLHSYAWLCI